MGISSPLLMTPSSNSFARQNGPACGQISPESARHNGPSCGLSHADAVLTHAERARRLIGPQARRRPARYLHPNLLSAGTPMVRALARMPRLLLSVADSRWTPDCNGTTQNPPCDTTRTVEPAPCRRSTLQTGRHNHNENARGVLVSIGHACDAFRSSDWRQWTAKSQRHWLNTLSCDKVTNCSPSLAMLLAQHRPCGMGDSDRERTRRPPQMRN